MVTRRLAGLVVLGVLLPATRATAQQDREEIVGTVTGFFAAMKAKDRAGLVRYTDSLTRLTLLRPGPNGSRVLLMTGAQFLAAVTDPSRSALDEKIRNPVVQQDGDLATVWTPYQVHIDGKLSHCGTDAIQLARLGGQWKILSVSDTVREVDCGDPWP
ncbi:MAG: hypothetical protein AB7R55_11870 [Gemmatimonadales bacterium]